MELSTLNTMEEYLVVVQEAYVTESKLGGIPNLTRLYETFCGEWFLNTYQFLEINASAFKLTDEDLLNLEDKLDELNFNYPCFNDFKMLLDVFNLVYEINGMVFNEAVKPIW